MSREEYTIEEVIEVLNQAQAELRSMYKRVGFLGSNVLQRVDKLYEGLRDGDIIISSDQSTRLSKLERIVAVQKWFLQFNETYKTLDDLIYYASGLEDEAEGNRIIKKASMKQAELYQQRDQLTTELQELMREVEG